MNRNERLRVWRRMRRTALPFIVSGGVLGALCYAPSAFAMTVDVVLNKSVSCKGGSDGRLEAVVSNGASPFTYQWSNGATTDLADNLAAGGYSVTVTDANGATTTVNGTVTEPSTALGGVTSSQNCQCYGDTTGGVSVTGNGGTAPYAYSWSTGSTTRTVTGLGAGLYTIQITDAKGCIVTRSATVSQPPAPITATFATTDVTCNGANDGKTTVTARGGYPGYTYTWTGGGGTAATAKNLAPGDYSVRIADANNCQLTKTVTIAEPAVLTTTGTQSEIACAGMTAPATVTPAGGTAPYTYAWTNGATTATANLPAGSHSATVTDSHGCTASRLFTLTQPAALSTSVSSTDPLCHGGTGSAQIDASGGTAPYTQAWSTGDTTRTVNGLLAGRYTATVTDSHGCTSDKTVEIGEPSAIVVAPGPHKNVTCHGDANGSLSVSASGGTGTLRYDWTGNPDGDGTNAATGLAPGDYTVAVTDDNACTATKSFTVTEPAVLLANGTSTGLTAVGTCTGGASVAPTGGTGPYTVAWTPRGATTTSVSELCGPTAQAIVTDANQCRATYDATIVGPTADLSIEMTGGTTPVQAGETIAWTILASTSADAPSAVVKTSVPTGTKFSSLTAPAGWTCTTPAVGETGNIACTAATFAAPSATFSFRATVDELFGAGMVSATATISAPVIDGNATNDAAVSNVTVRSSANLVATKKVAFVPPRAVTYTIDVTNSGLAAQVDDLASDELVDVLPAELTLKSATATAGAATTTGNTVHWNGGLKKGETISITIQAEVLTSVAPGTTISNQATVHFDGDGDGVSEKTAGSSPDAATMPTPTTFTTDKPVVPDAGAATDGGTDGGLADGGTAHDGGSSGGPSTDGGTSTGDDESTDGSGSASGCSVGALPNTPQAARWLGGLVLGASLMLRRRRSRP